MVNTPSVPDGPVTYPARFDTKFSVPVLAATGALTGWSSSASGLRRIRRDNSRSRPGPASTRVIA